MCFIRSPPVTRRSHGTSGGNQTVNTASASLGATLSPPARTRSRSRSPTPAAPATPRRVGFGADPVQVRQKRLAFI